jgi:hypothetical protein
MDEMHWTASVKFRAVNTNNWLMDQAMKVFNDKCYFELFAYLFEINGICVAVWKLTL